MRFFLRGPKPIACYLGYSQNQQVNFQSASGGVVSQMIINHLLDGGIVITPQFDSEELKYRVVQVKNPSDYVVAASIYHDVDLVQSIKALPLSLNNKYLVTCLPCEASFVRKYFAKNNLSVVIIALACSGQQDYDATVALIRLCGLDKNSIQSIKYRGDGWLSGVQIVTKSGKVYAFPNLKGLWYNIFNSQLFTLEKCFTCTDVLGKNADIVCADPWLPEYIESEQNQTSYTLVFVRRKLEKKFFRNIKMSAIDMDRAILSQKYTIERKEKQLSRIKLVKLFLSFRSYLTPILLSNVLILKSFRILYSKFWKLVS